MEAHFQRRVSADRRLLISLTRGRLFCFKLRKMYPLMYDNVDAPRTVVDRQNNQHSAGIRYGTA